MANFYSDLFAPRGSASQIVQTGILPRRRFKSPSGISRVSMHSTRGYFDFRDSRNPVLAASDELRLMSVKSSDRIYELNLWVTNTGYGDWSGTFTADVGLFLQGQNHDGLAITPTFFASGVDIAGGAPHRRTDLFVESNVLQDGYRGWPFWEIMTDTLVAFNDVNDPITEFDIVLTVATGPPTGIQGAILVEMIFAPSGT